MRPWEIYAKEAKITVNYYEKTDDGYEMAETEMSGARALMTSYNRIGAVWSSASEIISGILCEECGFTGTSYTDAGGTIDGYMNTDFGLHTLGTDVCLLPNQSPEKTLQSCLRDKDSDTTIYCLQQAAHRRLYNLVNGNAVDGMAPGSEMVQGTVPWKIALNTVTGIVVVLELVGAAAIFLKWRKKLKKKNKTD